MPKATLKNDRGSERDYEISGGRIITLVYDDDDDKHTITFRENGIRLGGSGEFEFVFKDEDGYGDKFLLQRMYSPIPKSGLGEAALEYFKDTTGKVIYTRPNDGMRRDDESHLTGDALKFVPRMQKLGYIENWRL